jgi:predicted nucleic acid-binding protein
MWGEQRPAPRDRAVSLDADFVLDCVAGLPTALERLRYLRGIGDPLCISEIARARALSRSAARGDRFRAQTQEFLGRLGRVDLDRASIGCAAEIARELSAEGRRLDGVDLFVAASARRHRQVLLSRNPVFDGIRGVVRESY